MSWGFWVLLIIALILLFTPFVAVMAAAAKATLWIVGALLLIAAIIWAIALISRGARAITTPPGTTGI